METININGTEYEFSKLTDQQKILVRHVASLDQKLGNAQFELEQLQVARNSFMHMLNETLAAPVAETQTVG